MNIVNSSGTTVVLLVGIGLGLLAALAMLALGRAFNPPEPARDPATTNPRGIAHVDDLMTMGETSDRAVRDRMARKPRLGELTDQGMLPPPLLGTIPPVRQPTIPSVWRSPDFDRTAAELARHFREREAARLKRSVTSTREGGEPA